MMAPTHVPVAIVIKAVARAFMSMICLYNVYEYLAQYMNNVFMSTARVDKGW